jgi:hypothetical protein
MNDPSPQAGTDLLVSHAFGDQIHYFGFALRRHVLCSMHTTPRAPMSAYEAYDDIVSWEFIILNSRHGRTRHEVASGQVVAYPSRSISIQQSLALAALVPKLWAGLCRCRRRPMMRAVTVGWRSILVLVLFACSAMPAGAQGVGAIGGTVTDSSAAVMPGVSVTLSSVQRTIGANQQVITDERGAYQFLRLVPGTYIVKAELQGFRPAEQRNIVVNADATSRADLKLEIGSLEEGVTVTGEAPLLDTTSATKQTVITVEVLHTLPNRFDMWSAARVIPSITMSQVDVGGSAAFLQSGPTVHGSNSENGYFIDGMDVSNLDGNASGAIFFLDPFAFQEMNLQMGAAGTAYAGRGGLVYNMVTRTGTNQFHGGGQFTGANTSFVSDNLNDTLRTQLLASVPAVALAKNPNLRPTAYIKTIYDSGSWFSGPVIKDRLWFALTEKYDVLNQYVPGSYNPDGSQVMEDNLKWTISEKLAWQMTNTAQLTYFNNLQYRKVGHRPGGGTFASSSARNLNDKYPDVHQVKFTKPWHANMVVDVSYSRFRVDDFFRHQPEVKAGDVSAYESTTDTYTVALPTYRDVDEYRDQAMASISFFSGKHDIRAGYQFTDQGVKGSSYSTSGMRAVFTNGLPSSVNTYNVPIFENQNKAPVQYIAWDRMHGLYVQDKWTPIKKLVINAGLRFESDYGWQQPTCTVQTIFVASQCFPEIRGVPDFNSVVPRFSLVYDVKGDGRTAIKFAANRYNTPIAVQNLQRVNPAVVASDSRAWTVCAAGQTSGCDVNRDLIPQVSELGPSNGFSFGSTNRWDPKVKPNVSNEYSLELQHQLPGNVVASVGYTYRQKRQQFAFRNLRVPADSYIPLTVTEATSGKQVTVYNQAPSTRGQFDNLWTNDPVADSDYNGADISLNRRMSNGWSLMGGASFGKTTGDVIGGDLNNPNSQEFRIGNVGNDVPWSYRLSGVFDLPFRISTSGTAQYFAGFPELTTVTVNSRTVALTQSTQSVIVAPRGSTRYPNVFSVDLSVRRPIRSSRGITFEPRIDFYNVTNASTVLTRVTVLGPAYGRASDIQRGRLIKLGLSVDF